MHKLWTSCLGSYGMGTSLAFHLHSGCDLLPWALLPVCLCTGEFHQQGVSVSMLMCLSLCIYGTLFLKIRFVML